MNQLKVRVGLPFPYMELYFVYDEYVEKND